ncbi:MAG: hypothetical protein WCX77_03030 [Candidatus Paceibacterota bacterium]|jgi:hypothetical protein
MKKTKNSIVPEIRIETPFHEPEVREYFLTVPISKFRAGVCASVPVKGKTALFKVVGRMGASIFRNLFGCEGIIRVEMHPYVVRVWKIDAYNWDYIEKFILDSIRGAYLKFGYGEIESVRWHGTFCS